MNIQEAIEILGISPTDSTRHVKIKFRRLMHKHHPDSVSGEAEYEKQTKAAQAINEAYTVWKTWYQSGRPQAGSGGSADEGFDSTESGGSAGSGTAGSMKNRAFDFSGWDVNKSAFAERNIYDIYHMDLYDLDEEEQARARGMYQLLGKGRFFWNPDEEEFSCFLRSLHHLSLKLLKEVQDKAARAAGRMPGLWDEEELMQLRMPYQLQLFGLLADQFVQPLKCLHALEEPVDTDKEGREIFCVRAFAGAKERGEIYRNICSLKAGNPVYVDGIKNRRIQLSNGQQGSLGELSLQDDELYFCIIPLLKQKRAQVKLVVSKTEVKNRPVLARADLLFYLRIAETDENLPHPDGNDAIRMVLESYEKMLADNM